MQEGATALALDERAPDRVVDRQRLTAVAPAGSDGATRRVSLTKVSWSAPRDLDLAEWVEQGHRIGMMGRSAGWWIGDWLRYGNAKYGEKYSRAMKITGYDAQTLMNMVWVCSRIEISRRREKLSWSHHAEVAAVDLLLQEQLLNQAEAERLSVRDLREVIRLERRSRGGDGGEDEAGAPEATAVVCPQCGYHFDGH
jgi:hypothetical protein